MLKHRRENHIVNCLLCWKCRGRMGPNHFKLRDGGAICGICGDANPLSNLRTMPIILVNEAVTVNVAFTRSGAGAHGLHPDCTRAIGPWVNFQSGEVLGRALVYLGMTPEQLKEFSRMLKSWGQGSCPLTIQPRKKNLLRIEWGKLL
jgi:hypothetical protein